MAKLCPLFSGSDANSTYIAANSGGILIDAGCSFAALKKALEEKEIDMSSIRALFVTHGHSDHVKGIKTLLKRINIPVYGSAATLGYLERNGVFHQNAIVNSIEGGIEAANMLINFFPTSHDAEGSGGYTVTLPDASKISVCTDLGIVTDTVHNAIIGSRAVLLEANHDLNMLKKGPYPPELKLRIMSDRGHLSNINAAAEAKELLSGGTTNFVLGHLSKHNNTPELALGAVSAALLDLGARQGKDYLLRAADPKDNEVIYL